jgi:hypothetical protein
MVKYITVAPKYMYSQESLLALVFGTLGFLGSILATSIYAWCQARRKTGTPKAK